MRRPASIVALLFGLSAPASPRAASAQQREEILSYDVLVDVGAGGRLLVTEDIRVRALGVEIRRGIYRDFPTSFPRWSRLGRIEAPFQVHSVLRDGRPEPYAVLSIGGPIGRGGVRVRAGQEDVLLEPGVYAYRFAYETDRWVSFGDVEDQLFWNVTGNGWSFPINSASARIRVADLDVAPTLEAWTGPEGSTARLAESAWDGSAHEATFVTTTPLGPGEGLTVRLTFPSGQLPLPTEAQQSEWFALDWGGYVEAGYIVLLVIAVYLLMWRRVGMDPPGAPTPLRTDPPDGFSPAALGYLSERGYDMGQLAAALVSMAMKGALRIERTGRTWTLHKLDGSVDLSAEERAVFDALLSSRRSIELKQTNHADLKKAIRSFKRELSRQLEREYFVNNRLWFAVGLGVSLIGLAALTWRWRFGIEPMAGFVGLWLTFWTLGVATLVTRVVSTARQARAHPLLWVGAGFLALFSLPFVAAELGVAAWLFRLVPSHLALAVLIVGGVNVLFYHLLERPTLRGRGVLDQLEGFRSYLIGKAPPADSGAEHFERYLPHAIALGVEERWASGFGAALDPAGGAWAGPNGRTLPWYQTDDDQLSASSFASSLGSSLSSTLSASSMAPGSSGGEGGGGGGSSGGGGGGGGGGGW